MTKRLTVPDVIDEARAYYAKHPAGGSLHIVLEDNNVRNSDVQFCLDYAQEIGDQSGVELAKKLLLLTRTQRLKLAANCK